MQEVVKQQRWSVGLSAVLLALGAAGCPGTVDPSLWPTFAGSAGAGSPGAGGAGVPACDPAPIFRAKFCFASTCHDASGTAANFDMVSAGWETHLVGVNPKGAGLNPSMCAAAGPYLVAGMQPATGLFLDKLKPNTMPACGVLMPQIGEKLNEADFECVQSWANALVMAGPGPTGAAGASGGSGGSSGVGGSVGGTSGGGGGSSGAAGRGGAGGVGGRGGSGGGAGAGGRGGTGGGAGAGGRGGTGGAAGRGGTGGSTGGRGGTGGNVTDGGGQ